jgi:hypothetical protein
VANEAQTHATDFWSAADKAILGLCETLALLFGLPFGEDLYNDRPIAWWHIFYLAVGLMFAIAGPMLVYLRTRPWFSKKTSETLSRIATDPLVWLAILLALFWYGTGPELYLRATGPTFSTAKTGAQSSVDDAATVHLGAERDEAIAQRDDALAKLADVTKERNAQTQTIAALQTKIDSLRFGPNTTNGQAAPISPTITSLPQSLPVSSGQGTGDGPIVDVSPDFLMNLYRNKTNIQGDAEASLYLGKRIKIHGEIRNLTKLDNGITIAFVVYADLRQVLMVFNGNYGDEVSTYTIGHNIDAVCRISEIEQNVITLRPCELIDASKR